MSGDGADPLEPEPREGTIEASAGELSDRVHDVIVAAAMRQACRCSSSEWLAGHAEGCRFHYRAEPHEVPDPNGQLVEIPLSQRASRWGG